MSVRKIIKLGDVIDRNITSYVTKDAWAYVNYLDTGNITQNQITEIQKIILANGEKLPSRAKRKVNVGDIVYSLIRPNQCHYGFIKTVPENFLVSTGFAVLRPIQSKVCNKFLYYLLIQDEVTESLQAIAEQSTSAYPAIKASDLENLCFTIPSIDVQKKIASVLSVIDDKIELNAQINHNLEEQAKAIFKSWFVDFEPFQDGKFMDTELGQIPVGWQVGTLKDMLDVRYGKDHKKLADGTIPIYGSGGLMRYAEKALYNGESVLIPRKGTLNNVMRVTGEFWTVDTMFYSVPRKIGAAKYLYHILSKLDLASMNSGSAVPSMTTDILNAIKIVLPTDEALKNFDHLTSFFWKKIETNKMEIQKLTRLRDALLPKLMSGEIDVSEVEATLSKMEIVQQEGEV